jgi:hypothetical protein
VTDTGRGISAQALPRIFERLFQDEAAPDNGRIGLGLGLYIAKEIVTLHRGRMWAASEPGEGATFSFHLPVYSLARLLTPVLTENGKLRPSFVLAHVKLTPWKTPPLGSWKTICAEAREAIRKCVYVDKDLVLPPIASTGVTESVYVVASTDMERVPIMLQRIETQLKSVEQLGAAGKAKVGALALGPVPMAADQTVEQQLQAIAQQVQEAIREQSAGLEIEPARKAKNANASAISN